MRKRFGISVVFLLIATAFLIGHFNPAYAQFQCGFWYTSSNCQQGPGQSYSYHCWLGSYGTYACCPDSCERYVYSSIDSGTGKIVCTLQDTCDGGTVYQDIDYPC